MHYNYLLILSIILLFTKGFGLFSKRVHMPQVVGALLAGVILGPSLLGIVEETEFIKDAAEIGVILLMFLAGLDTELKELKLTGASSVVIAVSGVLVHIIGATILYYLFFGIDFADKESIIKAVFFAIVLTATSVSTTVETLREMGKLSGRMGTTILGAAIADDIIGVIILTVITSISGSGESILGVLFKIAIYFAFIGVISFVIYRFKGYLNRDTEKRRRAIFGLVFCFFMAFLAEEVFGISNIIGAYFAGVMLCSFGVKEYIGKKVNIISYLFFSPIFFTSIGLKIKIDHLDNFLLVFGTSLLLVAILTKIIGCFLGARLCKIEKGDALSIATGMVARGEVSLIIAQKGITLGILDNNLFSAVVVVVILTMLVSPVLLKFSMKKKASD